MLFTCSSRLRKEVWIRPDGSRRGDKGLPSSGVSGYAPGGGEENDLHELSNTDLNRRFNNTFLYLIGKLYTHINMETFSLALDLLTKEFRVLVSRSPLPIDSKRLVQIMALNMFVIEHAKMKSSVGGPKIYRSAMMDSALRLAFEVFTVLVERCNVLLQSFRPSVDASNQCVFPDEDLPSLLSAVKVWCDWLLGNNDTWYPVVSDEAFVQFAQLATHLEKLKPLVKPVLAEFIDEEQYLKIVNDERSMHSFEMVKLGEDAVLCGFNPWFRGLDWSVYRRYAPRSVPATLAQDVRRIDAINFCVDFLEGLEPPIMKWSLPDNAHISLAMSTSSSKASAPPRSYSMFMSNEQQRDRSDETSYSDEERYGGGVGAPPFGKPAQQSMQPQSEHDLHISRLKMRKEELERQEREGRRMRRQFAAEHVSTTLEICPRFIVPDTNCFIDYLAEIRQIAQSGSYGIRVPVVVLNELDGLAKGVAPASSAAGSSFKVKSAADHAMMVTENARRALAYLSSADSRNANIRSVTSKGTTLNSLGITTEDDACRTDDKKNDDLILDTCQNLCTLEEVATSSDSRVVRRDVVLVTEDRNLKLKAHLSDIPVNKMPDFIKWAFPC